MVTCIIRYNWECNFLPPKGMMFREFSRWSIYDGIYYAGNESKEERENLEGGNFFRKKGKRVRKNED